MHLTGSAVRAQTPAPARHSFGNAAALELIETLVDRFRGKLLHIFVLEDTRAFWARKLVVGPAVKLCWNPGFDAGLAGGHVVLAVLGNTFWEA